MLPSTTLFSILLTLPLILASTPPSSGSGVIKRDEFGNDLPPPEEPAQPQTDFDPNLLDDDPSNDKDYGNGNHRIVDGKVVIDNETYKRDESGLEEKIGEQPSPHPKPTDPADGLYDPHSRGLDKRVDGADPAPGFDFGKEDLFGVEETTEIISRDEGDMPSIDPDKLNDGVTADNKGKKDGNMDDYVDITRREEEIKGDEESSEATLIGTTDNHNSGPFDKEGGDIARRDETPVAAGAFILYPEEYTSLHFLSNDKTDCFQDDSDCYPRLEFTENQKEEKFDVLLYNGSTGIGGAVPVHDAYHDTEPTGTLSCTASVTATPTDTYKFAPLVTKSVQGPGFIECTAAPALPTL